MERSTLPRRIPLLVALLTLLSGLAGCLGGDELQGAALQQGASPAVFDLDGLLVERLALQTADGASLDMVVFRPDVEAAGAADVKVPILADVGPYYGNAGGPADELSGFDQRLAEYFVPRGYAVARVSLRGTGLSEGCFDLGGLQEQQDVHDIVEFLGAQPWSNGAVALIGKSYDGTTPWEAAITQPAALKTIVPISGISDMYRYTFYDGVPYPETLGFETYYPLLVDHDVSPDGTYSGQPHLMQNLVRTCADIVPHTEAGVTTTVTGDHGDPFWIERDYEDDVDKIQVPVFLVHGLHDWNVKPDNSVPLYNRLDVPKAAWLGQWNHDYPDINRYKSEWSRHDWNETLLTWFDHWLKGIDNDWSGLAHAQVQDQAGTWRNYTAWPPMDAQQVTLSFTKEGTLAAQPGAAATFPFNDPLARGYDFATGMGGEAFVSAPLSANVTLFGAPEADLHLEVDRPGANLVVKLYDLAPDGTLTELDHGARELRHRDSRDAGTPVPPGQVFNTTVRLYPQELTVAAQHRLVVVVQAEDSAWFLQSPFVGTTFTLHVGDEAPSRLLVLTSPNDATTLRAALAAAPQDGEADPLLQLQENII